jgi:CHAT domain-containing protein
LIYANLNDGDAATRELREARQWLPRITDSLFRSRIESELPGAEANIAFAVNPATAVDALTKALDISVWSGSGFERASLHRARGQAYRAAGNIDASENDHRRAIDLLEEQRAPLAQRLQISFFDRVWGAFDDIIALQVFDRDRPDIGLEFAERGRARTLLDTLEDSGDRPRPTVAYLRHQLPSGTALLYFSSTERALLSWVIARNEVTFAIHPISKAALSDLVTGYRRALQQRESAPNFRDLSSRLYEALLRPQEAPLAQAKTVVVIPDGALHDLPFASLLDARTGRFFVEDHEVGFAPSAAIFAQASEQFRRRQTADRNRMLVVGNPLVHGEDNRLLPSLPSAEAEATAISRVFRHVLLLLGAEATKQRFLKEAPEADVIHFAGHAISNPEHPLLSRLLLASDSPSESGTLFGHELQQVRFPRTRVVVLSGCSTAAGSAQRGEGVLSLARSFVAAGVPSVVASLWDIDDQRSQEFIRAFYAALSEQKSPVSALRTAQLSAIVAGRNDSRTFSTWSAFIAIGGAAAHGS